MIKTVTKLQEHEEVVDVLCNMCGLTTGRTWADTSLPKLKDFYFASLVYETGYLSTHLPDDKIYEIDICEECVAKIIRQCKIPPTER